jgi:hypothetical protein
VNQITAFGHGFRDCPGVIKQTTPPIPAGELLLQEARKCREAAARELPRAMAEELLRRAEQYEALAALWQTE